VEVFGLLLFLLVSACAAREPEQPLRLGTQLWPGTEPLFLARELGYLDDGSVRLVEYSSLEEATRDFRNGMLDAVNVTLDMALLLQQQGYEPRVVLAVDTSNGADAILARPGVRRLRELRGKRVAVEDLTVSTYLLGRALEQAGLQPSDVRIIRLPVDQHLRAYESGQVDAVVTYQPFAQQLLSAGAHELFNSSQIPGEIIDVLVVRADVLDQNPEQVAHLLQGWFQALGYLETHPEDAAARMGPRLGTSPTGFTALLRGLRLFSREENLVLLREPDSPLLLTALALRHFMLREGLMHEPVGPERILDARPLEALQLEAPQEGGR
jgi:NitT/TauT family transport system substrate-binding protein